MKTSVILSLVAGIAAGAAAGAAIGLLYAPDSGENTRRKIYEKGGELKDNLKSKISDIGEDINRRFEGVKEEAGRMMEKGKAKVKEARGDIGTATL